MAEPQRVADCVAAMQAVVPVPVTVKHRIGIDRHEDYAFVYRFVETVAAAGCRRFIVHARNAWLDGLDPKANREIPPLRYAVVHRLAQDFRTARSNSMAVCRIWPWGWRWRPIRPMQRRFLLQRWGRRHPRRPFLQWPGRQLRCRR